MFFEACQASTDLRQVAYSHSKNKEISSIIIKITFSQDLVRGQKHQFFFDCFFLSFQVYAKSHDEEIELQKATYSSKALRFGADFRGFTDGPRKIKETFVAEML